MEVPAAGVIDRVYEVVRLLRYALDCQDIAGVAGFSFILHDMEEVFDKAFGGLVLRELQLFRFEQQAE